MDKLAIFDIDFTITKRETMVELLKFFIKTHPTRFYYAFNSLRGFLGYKLKFFDEKKSKEIHLSFLKNWNEKQVNEFVDLYYENQLKKVLLKDGIDEIKKRKKEGYRVILSSASPEFYVTKLYEYEEVEKIFGSVFEFKNSIFTSKMIGQNNKGKEKVERLKKYIDFNNIDWKNSVMYSDSLSDSPLLELCGKGYLINYKKNTYFDVLYWK